MTQKVNFNPTEAMVSSARALFTAMALIQTIRPVVEGYQKEILQKHQFKNNEDYAKHKDRGVELFTILSPNQVYRMDDTDFQVYLKECNEARIKAGLHVDDPEQCPLLVAEYLECQAKRCLLEAMQPITKIDPSEVWDMKAYDKLVDLSLRLLAPFVGDSKSILEGKKAI